MCSFHNINNFNHVLAKNVTAAYELIIKTTVAAAELIKRCPKFMGQYTKPESPLFWHYGPLQEGPHSARGADHCYFPPTVGHLNVISWTAYAASIRLVLRFFSAQRLAVVEFASIVDAPNATLNAISLFLGVPSFDFAAAMNGSFVACNGGYQLTNDTKQNAKPSCRAPRSKSTEERNAELWARQSTARYLQPLVEDLCNLTATVAGLTLVPKGPICYPGY